MKTVHCDIGDHQGDEARFIPHGFTVMSGWICPDCWANEWRPHWPEWNTLTAYDKYGTKKPTKKRKDFRQMELF